MWCVFIADDVTVHECVGWSVCCVCVCDLRPVSLIWNTSPGCIIGTHALMLALHSVTSAGRRCLESPLTACPVKVNTQTNIQPTAQTATQTTTLLPLCSLYLVDWHILVCCMFSASFVLCNLSLSHSLFVTVCKFKAHKRCAVRSTNNCKWTTLASIGNDIIEDEDGVSLYLRIDVSFCSCNYAFAGE